MVCCAIISMVALGLYLLLLPPGLPQPGLGVSLAGITKSAKQGLSGMLSITNEGKATVFYFVAPPQVKGEGEWPALPSYSAGRELLPHQAVTVPVECSDDGDEWRVPICWSVQQSGFSKFRGIIRYNWHLNLVRLQRGRGPRFLATPESDAYWTFAHPPRP